MIYKLVRFSRQVRCWLGGNKSREAKHHLFKLAKALPMKEARLRLIPSGYQYNPYSHTYRGQYWTARALDIDGVHQYHLRFYTDGEVTGHWEIDPLLLPSDHLKGIDLRPLTPNEIAEIRWALEWED